MSIRPQYQQLGAQIESTDSIAVHHATNYALGMHYATPKVAIAMLTLSYSAWCAGPKLSPNQIQAALQQGGKYKTADKALEKVEGKRVRLASAMAADGISKFATFFNDFQAVAVMSAGANQQMRELKPADIESQGFLHAVVEIHARGAHGVGVLDRRYSEQRAHMVLQIGDRIVQPVEKDMRYRSGQSVAMFALGAPSGKISLQYEFDVTPQDLQSPVTVILIDGDGHKHQHEADLSGVLDYN